MRRINPKRINFRSFTSCKKTKRQRRMIPGLYLFIIYRKENKRTKIKITIKQNNNHNNVCSSCFLLNSYSHS